jgi:DNA-binding MarR family transcriptional regulator
MKKLRIDTVIRMCRRLERLFGDRIQSHLNALGYRDVPAAAVSLLPLLEGKGVRPVTLAAKLKISKQAVQQSLKPLEQSKYVETVPDPTDGRGKLVKLTESGDALLKTMHKVKQAVQDELRGQLGKKTFKKLEETLHEIEGILDPGAHAEGEEDASE